MVNMKILLDTMYKTNQKNLGYSLLVILFGEKMIFQFFYNIQSEILGIVHKIFLILI